jgi:uncharacterized protein
LRIDISQIASETTELLASFERSQAPELFDELRLKDSLTVSVLVSPQGGDQWLLSGSLSGKQVLICARTLEPFENSFETPMVIRVERTQSVAQQEMDDDDDEVFSYRIPVVQDYVDVTECVRQLVILQEPIRPVKDPDKDFTWNFDEKTSETPKVDPRWEKLKVLKRKMENLNG